MQGKKLPSKLRDWIENDEIMRVMMRKSNRVNRKNLNQRTESLLAR